MLSTISLLSEDFDRHVCDHHSQRQSNEFYTSTGRQGDCTLHKPSCITATPRMGRMRFVEVYRYTIVMLWGTITAASINMRIAVWRHGQPVPLNYT